MKVVYPPRKQAPYLYPRTEDATTATTVPPQNEADAAGGGFSHRVSSFSILPRSTSAEAFPAAASAIAANSSHRRAFPASSSNNNNNNNNAAASSNARGESLRRRNETARRLPMSILSADQTMIAPDWRLKDRMKTVGVGLVLALNCGTDPPDITKPFPCATLQCWIDPFKFSRSQSKEIIGQRLQQQYAKFQLAKAQKPVQYHKALDPTMEEVRNLCLQLRRQARQDRILFHYNGHGVPRPTANGELWVFDKNHTEYIPLSISDLRLWLDKPSIVVLDCSSAGVLLPYFTAPQGGGGGGDPNADETSPILTRSPLPRDEHNRIDLEAQASRWVNDVIVLCPCSEHEWLPLQPDFPADIFTSCLTTPIPIALRWFVRNNPASMEGIDLDMVDAIPGQAGDRKTPLGELNWIFTAVTDSIAWNILPKPLFQRLFRQDLMVASMFRNFLLADRILRSMHCTPISYPPLPAGISNHPLWQAWDLACDTMLFSLKQEGIFTVVPKVNSEDEEEESSSPCLPLERRIPALPALAPTKPPPVDRNADTVRLSSPFFSEQLTAFEVWLELSAIHKRKLAEGTLESPEYLPVVLQVLMSQNHRIQALCLLRKFLAFGPWAVNLSLSLGIFPYVRKLLQSPDYKSLLVSIWASILSFDPSCRFEMLKDGAFYHFVQHLSFNLNNSAPHMVDQVEASKERTLAAFVLAAACHDFPGGQTECGRLNLHGNCCALLSSYEQGEHSSGDAVETHLPAHFRLWMCICLGNMVQDNAAMQNEAFGAGVHTTLTSRLKDVDVDVRSAVCYALGCLLSFPARSVRLASAQDLQQQHQSQKAIAMADALASQRPLMMPGGAQASTFVPGQLQPIFSGSNAQWRPQQAGISTLQQQSTLQGRHLGQPNLAVNPVQHPPPGFLVCSNASGLQGQPIMNPPFPQLARDSREFGRSSVFEDRHRLELDMECLDALLCAAKDASVMVRYEATIGLAVAVAKYFEAFVVAAEEVTLAGSNSPETATRQGSSALPRGLDRRWLDRFGIVWQFIRGLQHDDAFPAIAQAANDIVRVVHEQLLRNRMEAESSVALTSDTSGVDTSKDGLALRTKKLASMLGGIAEDRDELANTTHTPIFKRLAPRPQTESPIRRVVSEVASGKSNALSMEEQALLSKESISATTFLDIGSSNYSLPKSQFYGWKKRTFDLNSDREDEEARQDPLSPIGAARAFIGHRNYTVREESRALASQYACLAPKAPKPTVKSIEMILEEEEEDAKLLAAEEEAQIKKKELELSESRLLRNESVSMTSMMAFHPYAKILMSCGATDSLASWNWESGLCLASFENGNPKGSRMTTSTWLNEEAGGLFLVGCDDGTVRIWGDLVESTGRLSNKPPSIFAAFEAAPMKAGAGGSGLVCEWQAHNNILLAGGNSTWIHCWDLHAEKLVNKIETGTEALITSMTTAWDYDRLGMTTPTSGYQGIGPNIVVAGQSDGALKIFDIRTNAAQAEAKSGISSTRQRRGKPIGYKEHKSWVISTAFTYYGDRHEIISGTVGGSIKAWDLRMSHSLRTLTVQRSTMTAFAVHSKIPIMATGSKAQFVKVLTLDGDTMQIIRFHEKLKKHTLGIVSCVTFHPYMPLLAVGELDTFIGLYTTKSYKPVAH